MRLGKYFVHLGAFAALLLLVPYQTYASCCRCSGEDPTKNICLTTTEACGNLQSLASKNPKLVGITCTKEIGAGECKLVEQGGLCHTLSDAASYDPSANTQGMIVPDLANKDAVLSKAKTEGGLVKSGNIGEYIASVYSTAIGLSVIAAAIMVVYGGFLYLLGGTIQSINSGKEKIWNALLGLVLVFSSYTILNMVNPKLTGTNIISMMKGEAISDTKTARAMAESFARKPPVDEVDVISEEAGSAASAAAGAAVPTPIEATPGGQLVKDAQGNLVALGGCPGEMVKIPYSEKYQTVTKKYVKSFCMDRYEAPNQKGVMPYEGVTEWEADLYCNAIGKRLCADSEWTRACLGPNGDNAYGYGPEYIQGRIITAAKPNSGDTKKTGKDIAPCNYDSDAKGYITASFQTTQHSLDNLKPKTWEEALLNPKNKYFASGEKMKDGKTYEEKWLTMMKAFDGVNAKEPSGARKGCMTAEGVFDMTANVQEITLSDDGLGLTIEQRIAKGTAPGPGKPYRWRGFYWNPIAHLGNTAAEPKCTAGWGVDHAVGWRGFENGFRCCLSLQD